MPWHTIVANIVSGAAVAAVAGLIALFVTNRYSDKQNRATANRQRDLAAAADLYRVHGQFYAAWKVWNLHFKRRGETPTVVHDQVRSEATSQAADAEGGYESFILRVALEHDLTEHEEVAMWCLRFAFKELRYAIEKNQPLRWWRSDIHATTPNGPGYRDYQCFKALLSIVAEVLIGGDGAEPSFDRRQREKAARRITGSGSEYVRDPLFARHLAVEKQQRTHNGFSSRHWEWIIIGELIASERIAASEIPASLGGPPPRREM